MKNDITNAVENQVVSDVSAIFPMHLADLRASGLSDATICGAGIKSVSGALLDKKVGTTTGGDGYAIPYKSVDFERYKVFGGVGGKYMSPVGSGVRLFVPHNLPATYEILVITEGEKKALKACQEGIACVALGGVDSWTHQKPDARPAETYIDKKGVKQIYHPKRVNTPVFPALLKLCAGKRVLVLADSDAGSNQKVERAMKLLAQAINHQVAVTAIQYAACPIPDGGHKHGLDDWIIAAGAEAVTAAINAEARDFIYMPARLQIPFAPAPADAPAHKGMLYYKLSWDAAGQPFLPRWTRDKVVTAEGGSKDAPVYKVIQEIVPGVPYAWVDEIHRIAQTNGEHIITTENVREAEVFTGITDSRNPTKVKILSESMDDKKFWRGYGFDNANITGWQQILAAQKQAGMLGQKLAVTKKGWIQHLGCRFYGYGDDTMIKSPKAIADGVHIELFTRSNSGRQISGVEVAGTFEAEREIFRTRILTNPAMATLIGFAASAPLLSLMGPRAEAGIIHLFGASGHGKSTVQKAAAALIGNPGKPGEPGAYGQSWNATQNGMESPLESKDDCFSILDELHLLPRSADTLALLYMAANGAGKKRMTKEIEERMAKGWTTQILSSGEISFQARLNTDGYASMPGGLQFRTIDLPIGEVPYLQDWTGPQVMQLEADLLENHGHAWPLLIDLLMTSQDAVIAEYNQIDAALATTAPAGQSRIYERRRKHIAASLTGLTCILEVYQVPDAEAAQIREAAGKWAREYLWPAGLDSIVGDEAVHMLANVDTWVVSNPARFIRAGAIAQPREAVGMVSADGTAFVFESGGVAAMAKQLTMDQVRLRAAMISAGWIRQQKRVNGGKRVWGYLSPEALFPTADES